MSVVKASNVGPNNRTGDIIWQKSDWAATDGPFTSPGTWWVSSSGNVSSLETESAPFELWGYSSVQMMVNFATITGTTPHLTVYLNQYSDPAGLLGGFSPFEAGSSANYAASGGAGWLITGMASDAGSGFVRTSTYRPFWARIMVVTSGTLTALGATHQITLLGQR